MSYTKDEFGLYVIVEHGKTIHFQYLYKEGGFHIEERDGKFVLFDCGEYGDWIYEIDEFDTLKDAFKIGQTFT